MCGLAGFLGPYSREDLVSMTRLMAHRGPDGEGYHIAPLEERGVNAGLGHRRLSIIDLSGGAQPIWNEDQTRAVILNGEIYNYRELRAELRAAGHVFSTASDTEVILHGFEEYGPRVVERLDGMFAFAVWDKAKGSFFLARDRFGIKPLYYVLPDDESLVFASEIKPLLGFLGEPEVHLEALYRFLLFGWSSLEETIFKGIRVLLPAHWMSFSAQGRETKRYWRIGENQGRVSESGAPEIIRELLAEAVSSHLVADVPVGLTLSGGLDSSTVLAFMADLMPPEMIQAFTVGYGRDDDEIRYARLAAKRFEVSNKEELISLDQVAREQDLLVRCVEEPLVHPVMGTTYHLAEHAARKMKVVLIGEGGDELFGGYPYYRLFGPPFSLAPGWLKKMLFRGASYLMPGPRTLARLLHPDWLDKELLDYTAHCYDRIWAGPAANFIRFELENQLWANQLLRIDKLTMAHSLEARVPFLDRALAEAAFGLDFRCKIKGGRGKSHLRRTMAGVLPESIVNRPKAGRNGSQALMPALVARLRKRGRGATPTLRTPWFREEALDNYLAGLNNPLIRNHPLESRKRLKLALAASTLETWAGLFLEGGWTARTELVR